ncbi:MAG: hypothetical protein ABTD50_16455 [Polyangiaceae bacterium]|jgi:hypothetical protein
MTIGDSLERHALLVPVESDVLDPGHRTAFTCRVTGPEGREPHAELWMSPEMTRAFVVEEIERDSRELRVALACVAARPTAFRGCLYVVFVEASAAPREALS